jgi:hypothetical protein
MHVRSVTGFSLISSCKEDKLRFPKYETHYIIPNTQLPGEEHQLKQGSSRTSPSDINIKNHFAILLHNLRN